MISFMQNTIPARMTDGVSLTQAIAALVRAKEIANCRPHYVKSLRSYLRQFSSGRENSPIAGFDIFTIEEWFAGRSESVTTQASNAGRLSALFAFCARRGWIDRNPCEMLERPRIERKPPQILTPEQAHKILDAARRKRPHMLTFFTLSMLAGIRPDELARITWSSVDAVRGIVTVDAEASKVRRRRLVRLEPEALPLLNPKVGRLPVSRSTRRRYLSFACSMVGWIDWPQDCLRHSAASYLLARHRDAGAVAMTLGNSPGILLNHYQELVSPEDCRRFWEIRP